MFFKVVISYPSSYFRLFTIIFYNVYFDLFDVKQILFVNEVDIKRKKPINKNWWIY